MATRTIDHLFNTYEEAVQAVAELSGAGVPPEDIALIESDSDPRLPADVTADPAESPAISGASLGAAIGAGLGVLDGVGSISIPGLEPLAHTGWILPTLALGLVGGVLGGVLGGVTRFGIRNRRAHVLATGLQHGRHLVMAQVDERDVPRLEALLRASRLQARGPDLEYDMEPVVDPRTVPQERAAIQRAEQRLDYE